MSYIDYLEWDSDFFNIKVGRIDFKKGHNDLYIDEIKSSNYELIYIFNNFDSEYVKVSDEELVDTKVNFKKKLNLICDLDLDSNVLFFEDESKNQEVIDLCIASGEYSRFKLDPHFSADKFSKLYTTWFLNALKKQKNEKIIVYKLDGKYVGLLILSFKNSVSIIEILAVNEYYRGKGIAKRLINSAIRESINNNCSEIRVATQKKNLPSCQLYSTCGFELFEATDIYHLWL